MTEQSPAVTISHPPDGLLRAVSPAVKFLLGTPLGGSLRRQLMVLNFTGRKSGRHYSIPVSAHRLDNALYALASAGWTANFRDGANAEVLWDGKKTTMRGELIRDPATVADLSHRAAESYGAKTRTAHDGPEIPRRPRPHPRGVHRGGAARRHARRKAHPRLVRRGCELEDLRTIRPHQVARPNRRVE